MRRDNSVEQDIADAVREDEVMETIRALRARGQVDDAQEWLSLA